MELLWHKRGLVTEDHTIIRVGKTQIGIIGLKETIEKVAKDYADKAEEVIKEELLNILKEKNYIPAPAIEEYARAFWREYQKFTGIEVAEESHGLEIKVLGPGCSQCNQMEHDVMELIAEMNLAADIEHVTDIKEIGKYGVMGTPALVINGKVKCVGSVPPINKLKEWLSEVIALSITSVHPEMR